MSFIVFARVGRETETRGERINTAFPSISKVFPSPQCAHHLLRGCGNGRPMRMTVVLLILNAKTSTNINNYSTEVVIGQ